MTSLEIAGLKTVLEEADRMIKQLTLRCKIPSNERQLEMYHAPDTVRELIQDEINSLQKILDLRSRLEASLEEEAENEPRSREEYEQEQAISNAMDGYSYSEISVQDVEQVLKHFDLELVRPYIERNMNFSDDFPVNDFMEKFMDKYLEMSD